MSPAPPPPPPAPSLPAPHVRYRRVHRGRAPRGCRRQVLTRSSRALPRGPARETSPSQRRFTHFPKLGPDAAVSKKVEKTPSKQRPAPQTPRRLGRPGAGPCHTRWAACCPPPPARNPAGSRSREATGAPDLRRGLQPVYVGGASTVPSAPRASGGALRQAAEWTWHQVPAPRAPPKRQSHSVAPREQLVYATCRIRASAGPAPRGPVWAWSCPFTSAGPRSGGTMSGQEGLSDTLRLAPGPEPEPKAN